MRHAPCIMHCDAIIRLLSQLEYHLQPGKEYYRAIVACICGGHVHLIQLLLSTVGKAYLTPSASGTRCSSRLPASEHGETPAFHSVAERGGHVAQ